jgi:hypothetical protein
MGSRVCGPLQRATVLLLVLSVWLAGCERPGPAQPLECSQGNYRPDPDAAGRWCVCLATTWACGLEGSGDEPPLDRIPLVEDPPRRRRRR